MSSFWKFKRGNLNFFKKDNTVWLRKNSRNYSKLTEENVEEIKIPVPWGHIAGKWWGNKSVPPVLALHGLQDNANSFDKLIPLLNIPSIVAIDLPGHGYSSPLPSGKTYNVEEFVITLHRIKSYLNSPKLSLIAHSLGASVAHIYSSIFPDEVKWLIVLDSALGLLSMLKVTLQKTISDGLDGCLKIEQQKLKSSPAYKLSELVEMSVAGSFGSLESPEAALTLLKRGILPADENSIKGTNKGKSKQSLVKTDFQDLLTYQEAIMSSLPEEEAKHVKENSLLLQNLLIKSMKNVKNFQMSETEDKYYVYIRDPLTKIPSFLSVQEEFVIESSKNIKCPVLFMRASSGITFGLAKSLFDKSLAALKTSSSYLEEQIIEGTHHVHLNNPKDLAPIINSFVDKVDFDEKK